MSVYLSVCLVIYGPFVIFLFLFIYSVGIQRRDAFISSVGVQRRNAYLHTGVSINPVGSSQVNMSIYLSICMAVSLSLCIYVRLYALDFAIKGRGP